MSEALMHKMLTEGGGEWNMGMAYGYLIAVVRRFLRDDCDRNHLTAVFGLLELERSAYFTNVEAGTSPRAALALLAGVGQEHAPSPGHGSMKSAADPPR